MSEKILFSSFDGIHIIQMFEKYDKSITWMMMKIESMRTFSMIFLQHEINSYKSLDSYLDIINDFVVSDNFYEPYEEISRKLFDKKDEVKTMISTLTNCCSSIQKISEIIDISSQKKTLSNLKTKFESSRGKWHTYLDKLKTRKALPDDAKAIKTKFEVQTMSYMNELISVNNILQKDLWSKLIKIHNYLNQRGLAFYGNKEQLSVEAADAVKSAEEMGRFSKARMSTTTIGGKNEALNPKSTFNFLQPKSLVGFEGYFYKSEKNAQILIYAEFRKSENTVDILECLTPSKTYSIPLKSFDQKQKDDVSSLILKGEYESITINCIKGDDINVLAEFLRKKIELKPPAPFHSFFAPTQTVEQPVTSSNPLFNGVVVENLVKIIVEDIKTLAKAKRFKEVKVSKETTTKLNESISTTLKLNISSAVAFSVLKTILTSQSTSILGYMLKYEIEENTSISPIIASIPESQLNILKSLRSLYEKISECISQDTKGIPLFVEYFFKMLFFDSNKKLTIKSLYNVAIIIGKVYEYILAESDSESEGESELDSEPEIVPEPKSEPKSEPIVEPKSERIMEPKPEPITKPSHRYLAKVEPLDKLKHKIELEPNIKNISKADKFYKNEIQTKFKPRSELDPEPQSSIDLQHKSEGSQYLLSVATKNRPVAPGRLTKKLKTTNSFIASTLRKKGYDKPKPLQKDKLSSEDESTNSEEEKNFETDTQTKTKIETDEKSQSPKLTMKLKMNFENKSNSNIPTGIPSSDSKISYTTKEKLIENVCEEILNASTKDGSNMGDEISEPPPLPAKIILTKEATGLKAENKDEIAEKILRFGCCPEAYNIKPIKPSRFISHSGDKTSIAVSSYKIHNLNKNDEQPDNSDKIPTSDSCTSKSDEVI